MDKTARPQVELPEPAAYGVREGIGEKLWEFCTTRGAAESHVGYKDSVEALYTEQQVRAILAESEARAEGLVKLLREVSDWIDNWEPNFADDAEWQPLAERITAAIAQEAERG